MTDLSKKILFDRRQEAGPDIRRIDMVPEAKQIQVAEDVAFSLSQHSVEGIGRDAGFQAFHGYLLHFIGNERFPCCMMILYRPGSRL